MVKSGLIGLFEELDEPELFATPERSVRAVEAMREVELDDVDQLLGGVRADDEAISQLAPMLGSHPLGFRKIVLWTSPHGTRARLHVWPPREWPIEQVHNHRFNFVSVILAGSYTHERYDVSGDMPSLIAAEEMRAGDAYRLGTDEFHRTLPSRDLTISLVLRSGARLGHSTSVDLETGEREEHFGSSDELRQAIDEARALIADPVGLRAAH